MSMMKQLNILEFFNLEIGSTSNVNNEISFLHVDKKITTLMKENIYTYKILEDSDIFDIHFTGLKTAKDKLKYLVKRISVKYVLPRFQAGRIDEIVNMLEPAIKPTIKISNNESVRLLHKLKPDCNVYSLSLNAITYYTSFNAELGPKYHHVYFKEMPEISIVDFCLYFAELLIINEVIKYLNKLKELSQDELAENIFYSKIREQICNNLQDTGELIPVVISDYPIFKFGSNENANIYINSLTKYNDKCKIIPMHEYRKNRNSFHMIDYMTCVYSITIDTLNLNEKLVMLQRNNHYTYQIINLFELILATYEDDRKTKEYHRSLNSDYAASFMTKKNIPSCTLDAMKNSKFNHYFGYVEFDQDIDLLKMKQIENEFISLANFFNQNYLDDYSIRFRRLGKHKAAGLYYPLMRCLCVDINHPSSLAHEYFHLLDYKNGCLSKMNSFRAIREKYTELIMKSVNTNDSLKEKLESKNKYNINYYLESTEVFARTGEIYLTKICKISNSLANPDMTAGFAYPDDESFYKLVIEYFENKLPELGK